MKSARINAFSQDPGDIRIEDVPLRQPGPGQVRVRMLMSPVNPSDLNFLRGTYSQALERIIWNHGRDGVRRPVCFDPGLSNPCPQPPYAMGGEGVGIVDACGAGWLARRLRGRRVAVASGPPNGTWQQCTVVDAKRAVAMPGSVPDEQAAMFFVNPVTAYVLVHEVLDVPRGGWVLVTAAGSSLGKSVVRIGRRDGFHTICVVRCLGLGGRLVIYGTLADAPLEIPGRDLMMPVACVSGFLLPNWLAMQSPLKLLGILRAVKRLTVEGVFRTEVGATFPLEEAARAVAASLEPGRTGKVMLRIATD